MTPKPDALPCKYCGKQPRIVGVPGDLFYAQCSCGKWHPYEFCGGSIAGAINNWNLYNDKTVTRKDRL